MPYWYSFEDISNITDYLKWFVIICGLITATSGIFLKIYSDRKITNNLKWFVIVCGVFAAISGTFLKIYSDRNDELKRKSEEVKEQRYDSTLIGQKEEIDSLKAQIKGNEELNSVSQKEISNLKTNLKNETQGIIDEFKWRKFINPGIFAEKLKGFSGHGRHDINFEIETVNTEEAISFGDDICNALRFTPYFIINNLKINDAKGEYPISIESPNVELGKILFDCFTENNIPVEIDPQTFHLQKDQVRIIVWEKQKKVLTKY